MKFSINLSALALMGLGALTLTTQANAQAFVNGSFEADAQATGTWNIYPNLTGWTGGPAGIELRNNVAGAAYDGNNYVELDTTANSLASQAVTTVGQLYTLSFAYSARENVAPASNGIEAYWNGSLLASLTGQGGPSGNNWSLYSYQVIGTSPVSLLEFRAVGTSDSYGGSLDAVSLTSPVPEPETYALLLAGLGLLGFAARRRRQREAT